MKKSQLRNIIRESIKELVSGKNSQDLLTEQATGLCAQNNWGICSQAGSTNELACSNFVNPGPNGYSTGPVPTNARSAQVTCCNENNTSPINVGGTNWWGATGYTNATSISWFSNCITIDGQVPQVGDHFFTGNFLIQPSSAPMASGGNVCRVTDVYPEQCTPQYDGTECASVDQPIDYPMYTGGGSTIANTQGVLFSPECPGSTIAPVLGCTDPNSASCDPNADQDDGSCGSSFIPDINAFMNSFGCHDPSATNYQPYIQPPGPIGSAFDVNIPQNFPNQTYSGPGCMVYNMMTTDCGASIVNVQDMFNSLMANGQDTSCCTYTPQTPTSTWKCAALSSGGSVAEQANTPMGCIEVNDGTGTYSSLTACETANPNIPNACGGGQPGPVLKKTDPTPAKPIIQKPDPTPANPEISRMQDLANIKRER